MLPNYVDLPFIQERVQEREFISLSIIFGLTLSLLWCEVQVAVADPLHLKPVPVVSITTALELNL